MHSFRGKHYESHWSNPSSKISSCRSTCNPGGKIDTSYDSKVNRAITSTKHPFSHRMPNTGLSHSSLLGKFLILYVLAVPYVYASNAVSGKLDQRQSGVNMFFGDGYFGCPYDVFHAFQRIGEASHPGPFEITICNVTGLNGKADEICKWSGNLCGITETAATESVIKREMCRTKPQRKHLFHVKPVPPNQITKNGTDSLKGQSKGVAILSDIPFRIAEQWSHLTAWKASRLIVGFARIAQYDTLVVTIYGFQRNIPDAVSLNGELHSQVLSILDSWRGPSIVLGDFNFDVSDSSIYHNGYQPLGLFDVRILEQRSTNTDIGPTTSQTSVTDSILVSKWFAERFVRAWIQQDSGLATHSPVHATFDLDLPCRDDLVWKLPIPFTSLPCREQIDVAWSQCSDEFEVRFQEILKQGDPDEIFTTWSTLTERCISNAIEIGKNPDSTATRPTSKRQLGRGQIPVLGPIARHQLAKKPRNGDYSPEFEAISVVAKQRVKQTRRLTSLHQRMVFQSKKGVVLHNDQNQQEWTKIFNSRGYGKSFSSWVIDHTDVDHMPFVLPSIDFVLCLQQRVQIDCDSLCKKQFRARSQQFKKTIQSDWTKGGKITFDIMAHRTSGEFQSMLVPCTINATRQKWIRKGIVVLKLDTHDFDLGKCFKVFHNDVELSVQRLQDNLVEVRVPSHHCQEIGNRVELRFHRWVYDCSEMAEGFFDYWKQFWERDDENISRDHWIEAMHHVESVQKRDPIPITVEISDIQNSIASTPTKSARGLCGWSIKEVKVIPYRAIALLKQAFEIFISKGWPKIFSLVRVALPPKVASPCQPKDGRPIAIMSQIYRVLSKPLAKKILIHFAGIMPRSIAGGLPGRDTMDIWYTIQHLVENALRKQQPLFGFCLDIQKCFNAIGRFPATQALIQLGVPSDVVESWNLLLSRLQRSVNIAGSCSPMHSSTTGIPEGDPMSVPCMVAICFIWHQHIGKFSTSQPWSFADNWEITSNSMTELARNIREIIKFLRAWKLKADIGKSWCWSTKKLNTEESRNFHEVCNEFGTIPFVATQKDLGAQIKYKRTQTLGSIKERFENATLRAQRLMSIPGTLEQKWRALKLGVASVALYGIEIASIGWQHFQKLRSAYADVLAEGRGNRNEWLACHMTNHSSGDPEITAIKRCFRAARRFLTHYQQFAHDFRDLIVHADPHTYHACGPSSTIKRWLFRLGWKTLPSGNVMTDNQIIIDLATTPLEYVDQQIVSSWTNKVLCEISHRQGLGDIPAPNPTITFSNIANLNDIDKKIAVKHIMGAYVCANKAKHWQEHDGRCCLCNSGQYDSMFHRVFECEFFSNIRKPFDSLLKEVRNLYPHWAFSPTIPTHPDEIRFLQICSLFPITLLSDHNGEYDDATRVYTFFTDGGCTNPDCPPASLASWSIVGDLLHDETQRKIAGQEYIDTKKWPTTLKPIAQGHIPYRQSNDRGELMAIVQCLSLAKHRVFIWSDSTYALDVLEKTIACKGDITKLQQCKNWDLVLYLVTVIQLREESDIQYNHIKAHEPIDADRHPRVQYVLGNYLADRHASKFLQDIPDATKTISAGIKEHYTSTKTLHRAYLEFACCLTKTTAAFKSGGIDDSEAGVATGEPIGEVRETNKIDFLKNWVIVGQNVTYNLDVRDNIFDDIPHPPQFTHAVINWLRRLVWPSNVKQNDVGVSWLELLTDLCVSTGCYPPITQGKWKGQSVFTEVSKGSASSLIDNPLKDQIAALRSCIRAVAAMHGSEVFPMSFFTKDCKSLLIHPGGRQSAGLTIRPKLIEPGRTIDSIARMHFLKNGGNKNLGFSVDRTSPNVVVPIVTSNYNCQSRITRFKQAKERLRR